MMLDRDNSERSDDRQRERALLYSLLLGTLNGSIYVTPKGGHMLRALKGISALFAIVIMLVSCAHVTPTHGDVRNLMWINHFDLLPGDPSVTTSFNAVSSGVGGGLTGLVIQSSTTGQNAEGGGNKEVHMGLQVPPGYLIKGVRVCYELSDRRSFISQIRLAQVQTPPQSAIVLLDDGTDQTNPGPLCVDSATTTVDPRLGEVLLSLRVNFGNTSDRIVFRALGLHLKSI